MYTNIFRLIGEGGGGEFDHVESKGKGVHTRLIASTGDASSSRPVVVVGEFIRFREFSCDLDDRCRSFFVPQ